MIVLLPDVNIEGQLEVLLVLCTGSAWRDIWSALEIRVSLFRQLGLDQETPDNELWEFCQKSQFVLVTANRNRNDATSLEETIRRQGTPTSLPVFTLADPDRILRDGAYARWVAEEMIGALLELDDLRGCGRLFIPRRVEQG